MSTDPKELSPASRMAMWRLMFAGFPDDRDDRDDRWLREGLATQRRSIA